MGFSLLTPANPDQRAGIVTFQHEQADDICSILKSEKIIVSSRSGYIRISPHFYNTFDEIEKTLVRIHELTKHHNY